MSPASLSCPVLRQLVMLNIESLEEAMQGLLAEEQIAAILERRDRIVEKVAADRKKYGDEKVFQE